MRALWSFYLLLTRFFGARRRFVRRIAALCLVVLGVHAAADIIDDLVYQAVDAVDLAIDGAAWRVLEILAGWGAFTAQEAVAHAQSFAEGFDLDQKDIAAKWLALLLELVMDLLLLDFIWGARGSQEEPHSASMIEELKASALELKQALWPVDLERLAVPPAVAGFAIAGTLGAALALEGFLADGLSQLIPLWPWTPNASAGVAILVAALLLWRFLPDLLHGALLRAHERGGRAALREAAFSSAASSKLAHVRSVLRRTTRGAFLAFIVLPLAVLGLSSQSAIFALVARTGTGL